MSARNYSQALSAGETIRLPAGRYFFIRSAASALDIATIGNPGSPISFLNVGAGCKFGPVAQGTGWQFLQVFSAGPQNIEIVISDDGDFEVASAVTVSGVAQVASLPSAAIANTPAVALPNAATTQLVPGNVVRRRVQVSNPSTAAASFFIRSAAGAANDLAEIQPGTFLSFETTAALYARNDSGGALSALILEET